MPGLTVIFLIFLPPNTTSVTQPMDQRAIRISKNYDAGYYDYAQAIIVYTV